MPEWLDAARTVADAGSYNVAVASCAHSAINAVDAMTILRAGRRSAGRHADALGLVKSVLAGSERADLVRQYSFLLDMKSPAEYGGATMTARQAADSLKHAERILSRVRAEIEK